jgi:hypothetical protein
MLHFCWDGVWHFAFLLGWMPYGKNAGYHSATAITMIREVLIVGGGEDLLHLIESGLRH